MPHLKVGEHFAKGHKQVALGLQRRDCGHINCLEALAAFHAVKCFVRDKKSITVLLRMDNTTAVMYLNKLGGTVSPKLNTIVRELWLWCMNWDINLIAEHLPGVLNSIADQESWVMRDRSDWMLNPRIFNKIQQKWGQLEVDMFASRLTTQLKRFFSWRPDTEAEALDAPQSELGQPTGKGLCQPFLEPNRQGAEQSTITSGHNGPSGSSMEEPAMVPHPTGHASRLPSPPSSQQGPDYSNIPRECASNGPPTSRMAYPRQRFQSKEISEEGTELLLASWRQKSSKSYDSLFGKWVDWCNQQHSDPVSGPIKRSS